MSLQLGDRYVDPVESARVPGLSIGLPFGLSIGLSIGLLPIGLSIGLSIGLPVGLPTYIAFQGPALYRHVLSVEA